MSRFGAVVVVALAASAIADDLFVDATGPSGLLNAGVYSLPPDLPSWIWAPAGAVGDFNRDGRPDIFLCAGPDGADKLFLNNGDATFTDHAADWGVNLVHVGQGASVADFNNDGWPDIYLCSWGDDYDALQIGRHKLYRNNGDGSFTDIAESAGLMTTSPTKPSGLSASWADIDGDGDLDLAVPGFFGGHFTNHLYRNNGDETFTDVTVEVLGVNMNGCYAFLMRFVDMNGDLAPDMYWVGDTKTSHYFKNDGAGAFSLYTQQAGLGLDQNGMGADIGDVNNDGLPDMYVSSIFGPSQFQIGNRLYINMGDHQFDEIAVEAGVADGGWGWATLMQDLDNDGDCDLADTSGRSELGYAPHNDPLRVWLNDGDGASFTEISAMPQIDDLWGGRGLCWIDYDLDGDLDLLIIAAQGQPYLCRNETSKGDASWLHVTLDTSIRPDMPPDGVGARVMVTAGGVDRFRWVAASSNFLSQNETAAHFGLADAAVVDAIVVEWPNGELTTLAETPVNTRVVISPQGCKADMNADGLLNILDFVAFQAAFLAGDPKADVNGDGFWNILDFMNYQLLFTAGCG